MNKCIYIGRLTKDPELKYIGKKNTAICNFTIAVDRIYKQEGQPDVDFIPVIALGQQAEFSSKYFSKGQRVGISGRMQIRMWEKDNVKHYVTECIAETVESADGNKQQKNTQQGGLEPQGNPGFFPIDDDNPFL